MPKSSRLQREKHRKKTRYSSDSDSDREVSRKYREKERSRDRRSREKTSSSRHNKESSSSRRRRNYSSSSSSSSSRSSSSSSSRDSRSSTPSSREKSSSRSAKASSSSTNKKNFDHITKFEINDLYKEEDKVKIIDDIEADSFKQEAFQSKKKIVVDLQKDKIIVPENLNATDQEESLIHPNFLGDEEVKVDKWIKKLHLYRNQ
ncbi:CLUMA_CG017417, isoform A [Clunio marinus]|uniref:CLUMA_CG017417, isoform A n=1 Tax=Clunio marinus TaxID=568069 RepID=A0A1J1IX90_9DIPT|nr:CLUMA_CG017417, isoform A [Clunio marinus]